ncbi:MAG: hypothetical protein K5799_15085 [Erythrobacter sp.]|nr:hypothetical protein [Erythrobacter sp.]
MNSLQSTTVLHLLTIERGAQLRRAAGPSSYRHQGATGRQRVGLALIRLGNWLAPAAERTLVPAP